MTTIPPRPQTLHFALLALLTCASSAASAETNLERNLRRIAEHQNAIDRLQVELEAALNSPLADDSLTSSRLEQANQYLQRDFNDFAALRDVIALNSMVTQKKWTRLANSLLENRQKWNRKTASAATEHLERAMSRSGGNESTHRLQLRARDLLVKSIALIDTLSAPGQPRPPAAEATPDSSEGGEDSQRAGIARGWISRGRDGAARAKSMPDGEPNTVEYFQKMIERAYQWHAVRPDIAHKDTGSVHAFHLGLEMQKNELMDIVFLYDHDATVSSRPGAITAKGVPDGYSAYWVPEEDCLVVSSERLVFTFCTANPWEARVAAASPSAPGQPATVREAIRRQEW